MPCLIENPVTGNTLCRCHPCDAYVWGIERSGFFNGREKWVKGFENQMV